MRPHAPAWQPTQLTANIRKTYKTIPLEDHALNPSIFSDICLQENMTRRLNPQEKNKITHQHPEVLGGVRAEGKTSWLSGQSTLLAYMSTLKSAAQAIDSSPREPAVSRTLATHLLAVLSDHKVVPARFHQKLHPLRNRCSQCEFSSVRRSIAWGTDICDNGVYSDDKEDLTAPRQDAAFQRYTDAERLSTRIL